MKQERARTQIQSKKNAAEHQPFALRRDRGRPSCRACGEELFFHRKVEECRCGWQIPASLQSLLSS